MTTPTMQRAVKWQPKAATLRIRACCSVIAADLVSVITGFALAASLRGLETSTGVVILAALLPVYAFIAFYTHAYAADHLQSPLQAAAKGAKALFIAVCAVILIAYGLKTSESFSRGVLIAGTATTLGLLISARYLLVRHMPTLIGGNPFSVMLLHDGHSPVPPGEFSVVMTIDDSLDPQQHDPVMYDRLAKIVASADRVVVACAPGHRAAWAHALKGTNVQGEIYVPELTALTPLGVSAQGEAPTVVVSAGPLGLFDRFIKRGFDVAVSGAGILLLAPFLCIIALLIKWDSPGPVLFKQVRIGRANEMFRIWKFRSMRVEQSDGAGHRSASRDDDRITRVGRILRRTSLDEIPQLFNVLIGDMSIVGPRPHALGSRAAEKLFWEVDGRYWHRHAAKPGVTGLAQIRGYRGATIIEDDLR
ncbi:sugar transferase, partial [Sphingomonas sp. MJ1 (PH-R8)]|uniref:sugar transferase n=1 Tax=Sphingomonas sp. MJ1 (PH-R8) TaxID=3112950 RepID=UPI003A8382EA